MYRLLSIFMVTAVALAACDFDIVDLDSPSIDELTKNPNRTVVGQAATGLLVGNRGNTAASNGYIVQVGILGRETQVFDPADPRYNSELLRRGAGLNQGSPFGGNFWAGPYANIALAHLVLEAVPKVSDFTAEEREGIIGFTKTMMALDLLRIIDTHYTNGAVIETGRSIDEPLAPIATRDEVYTKIATLLDEGAMSLNTAAATPFAFRLGSGFSGFDTPALFRQFNRAIRARVAAYMDDANALASALDQSFLASADVASVKSLEVGVYHTYSTAPGDATNAVIAPTIFTHPKIVENADEGDARVARKVTKVSPGGSQGAFASEYKFTIYGTPAVPDPQARVPIIRVEELVLLRAELHLRRSEFAEAVSDINLVRVTSGGLAPFVLPGADVAKGIEDQLLYERRYSLLFEGHRWIDMRRFGRTATNPFGRTRELTEEDPDVDNDMTPQREAVIINVAYPIPLDECNARPDTEPACSKNSLPPCGDGFVDPNEQCDDGNTVDGDGCSPACRLPAAM